MLKHWWFRVKFVLSGKIMFTSKSPLAPVLFKLMMSVFVPFGSWIVLVKVATPVELKIGKQSPELPPPGRLVQLVRE
jgi:hypothetical protein